MIVRMKPLALGALVVSALCTPALAQEIDASWSDGLTLDWGDRRELSLGARVHYDIARFSDDLTAIDNDQDFRRARPMLRARHGDWRLRADYDFGIAEGWRNLNVEYAGFRRHRITVGHQVAPFSLDELGSSNDLAFLERSLASALSPGMLLGAAWRHWGDQWTVTAGVFTDELNEQDRRTADGVSLIGRFTYSPVNRRGRVLHFGVAQEFRSVEDGKDVRFSVRPESRLANARLIDTGRLAGVDNVMSTGLELLGIYDNFRLQAEYIRSALDGAQDEPTFSGGYIQAGVVLTGERYRYSGARGVPTAIRPRGRMGALEALVRYSMLDLSDGLVAGGRQKQFSVGLSWRLNRQLRLNLNYSRYDTDPGANGLDESGSLWMLRAQLSI